jgi:hypothetical protein
MLSPLHSTCRTASPPTGSLSDYVESRVPCQIPRGFGRSGRALPTRLGSGFVSGHGAISSASSSISRTRSGTQSRRSGSNSAGFGLAEFDTRVRQLVAGDQLIAFLIDCMLHARKALWQEHVRLHEVVLAIVRQDELCRRSCAFRAPVRSVHCRGQQTKTKSPN